MELPIFSRFLLILPVYKNVIIISVKEEKLLIVGMEHSMVWLNYVLGGVK